MEILFTVFISLVKINIDGVFINSLVPNFIELFQRSSHFFLNQKLKIQPDRSAHVKLVSPCTIEMERQLLSFEPMKVYFLIVTNALRKRNVPIFVCVPVTTSELVLTLKAFDTIFFLIKQLDQLITKFGIVPKKKIII